jgi:hypothetical protein
MFIYKITVLPLNKSYIGLDTSASYKQARWKSHCRDSVHNPKGKLHQAMHQYGINNCNYEIIEDNFSSVADLALAEIRYISEYNSYNDGLNSTVGGDGLGKHDLTKFTDDEILAIRTSLGLKWKLYNIDKWKNTSLLQRADMMQHLYTPEVINKRIITQKLYYAADPRAKEKHSAGLVKYIAENKDSHADNARKNGPKSIAKCAKQLTVQKEDGTIIIYASISSFTRETGIIFSTLKSNSSDTHYFNGYKIIKIENSTVEYSLRKKSNKRGNMVIVKREDGSYETYASGSEFERMTGQYLHIIKKKSERNIYHNGYLLILNTKQDYGNKKA